MRSRIQRGLTIGAIAFIVLGIAAYVWLGVKSADQVSQYQQVNAQNFDGSSSDPSSVVFVSSQLHDTVVLTTLLPAVGVALIVVGILCAAGVVASMVTLEAVELVTAGRSHPGAPDDGAEELSASETLRYG
jgi:hypothetical protein